MLLYPAIISADKTGITEYYSLDDYVKVRIPQFHGIDSKLAYQGIIDGNGNAITVSHSFCPEENLPWAILQRDFSNKDFSATSFNPGDIVYVILENDDISTPIITGFASRFQYTDDPIVAEANRSGNSCSGSYGGTWPDGSCMFENFDGADAIVAMARSQIGEHDDGNNRVKYNDAYWGKGTHGREYAWCCAFVWWVFNNTKVNGESLAKYYYGEKKTAHCKTLMNYYKKRGQFITSGFKKGDIVFFDWSKNKTAANHVGIVVEDQKDSSDYVMTVEGNTSRFGSQSYGGHVMDKKRNMKFITGGARVTLPKADALNVGSSEQQVFNFLTRGMSFNISGETKTFNVAAACGILANIEKESSFNPKATGDKGTSYGLCQWHDTKYGSGRMTNLKKFCKKNNYDYTSITGQMMYLQKELTDSYTSVRNKLLNVPNTEAGAMEAARIWCKDFERPANKELRAEERANVTKNKYWPKYSLGS